MKENNNHGKCLKVVAWTGVALGAVAIIGGACLGTSIYKKVNTIQKAVVEANFGSLEGFNKYFDAVQSPEAVAFLSSNLDMQINTLQAAIEQNAAQNIPTPAPESGKYADVDTTAAMNDPKWNDNSNEAATLFELEGTPGNAVVHVKSGKFKAIGGAYPQAAFEEVVTALKEGKDLESDEIGKAGTLTKEQIDALLKDVHYKGDKNAEIVIIEYSDFLCPYCQRHYAAKTLENIVANDAKVALVFKNNPIVSLHPTAPLGAKGAECAGQLGGSEAFYGFIDQSFSTTTFTVDSVVATAEALGLDTDNFLACLTK